MAIGSGSVDHETRAADNKYFESRSLKGGSAGWVLLVGLGVAYVISGDFSGWNYGIAYGGWFGLLIAFAAMGIMYTCTVFGLAEMSSALPTAGAGYGFARRAMNKFGGFITGLAVLVEYICAPAAISTFIANYVDNLGLLPAGTNHIWIIAIVYAIFIAVHIVGVGEALKTMFVITAIALIALIAFIVGTVPSFNAANLVDITPVAENASTIFPFGLSGVIAALPFGIWFFLGIEGVPLAAEEASNPKHDMPRGIIGAMAILIITGLSVLLLAAGGSGAEEMATSTAPLVDALDSAGQSALAVFLNWAGLAGLVASFFSLIFAGSRQMFALSRSGYLPRSWALTGSRKTPILALVVQGVIGFLLVVIVQDGDILIDMAVFGACVSYAMMNLAHIILRKRDPEIQRGYRTPGGVITTGIGFILACVAILSTFFVDITAALVVLAVFIVGIIYFFGFAQHHLVANAPEEEFELLAAAEEELQ